MKVVVDSFADKADIKDIQSRGFYIAGHKYLTIKAEGRSLYGKMVWTGHRLSRRVHD